MSLKLENVILLPSYGKDGTVNGILNDSLPRGEGQVELIISSEMSVDSGWYGGASTRAVMKCNMAIDPRCDVGRG